MARLHPRRAGRIALVIATLVAAAPRVARADDKEACSEAYDATQVLRRDHKLQAARREADRCGREVCADFIRADCATWRAEIDELQPTLSFAATDPQGVKSTAIKVSLDGQAWLPALDGVPKPIDPGPHVLRFELAGARAFEQRIEVREGDKARVLEVTFTAPPAPAALAAPPEPDRWRSAPWIVGGAGVGVLAAGAVLGAVLMVNRSTLSSECVPASHGGLSCTAEGSSAVTNAQVLAPLTTAAFIAGGTAVGVGAAWLLLRRPAMPSGNTVAVGASVSSASVGLRAAASF